MGGFNLAMTTAVVAKVVSDPVLDFDFKPGFWETPRNIAILLGVAAAIAAVVGYEIAQTRPPPIIIIQIPAQALQK
jgi:ribose/xylose/arabinose/galactoside ABC-type transport system permease subunit